MEFIINVLQYTINYNAWKPSVICLSIILEMLAGSGNRSLRSGILLSLFISRIPMHLPFSVFFIVFMVMTSGAMQCDRNTTASLNTFKTALKPTSASESDQVQVSGVFSIQDGCTFRITNFTFFPAQISTYFYGSMDLEDKKGQGRRLSEYAIGGYFLFPEASFSLSQDRSFTDFRFIKIYSEFTGKTYAYVELPSSGSSNGSGGPKQEHSDVEVSASNHAVDCVAVSIVAMAISFLFLDF